MAEVVSGGFDLKVANLLSSVVQVHCTLYSSTSTVQELGTVGGFCRYSILVKYNIKSTGTV